MSKEQGSLNSHVQGYCNLWEYEFQGGIPRWNSTLEWSGLLDTAQILAYELEQWTYRQWTYMQLANHNKVSLPYKQRAFIIYNNDITLSLT